MNVNIDNQVAMEILYNEIEQLKNQIVSDHCFTNQEDEQLEFLIEKSIKYGELVREQSTIGKGIILRESDIDQAIDAGPNAVKDIQHHVEHVIINKALFRTRGNQAKAADLVGWNRGTFRNRNQRFHKKGDQI